MIRRPPRSTLDRSSAASDVYKRQGQQEIDATHEIPGHPAHEAVAQELQLDAGVVSKAVSYTHLRAHETVLDIVCRLLLEKKKRTLSTALVTSVVHNSHIHPQATPSH